MARHETTETPPRSKRALRAVPDPAPAKPAAKKAATPRPASRSAVSPKAPASSGSPVLLAYARFLSKAPPAKRALANAELEKNLAGIRDEIDEILLCVGPIFAFCVAALSEAVSQAYGATGDGKSVALRERYERIVAAPMRPTSRRAWAAYFAHADLDGIRTVLRTIPKGEDVEVAAGLAALNQAFCDVYAKADRRAE